MWEYFTTRRARAKKILADAAKEKQEGTQGQWQQESPFKEFPEQVKGYPDTDCDAYMMRRAYHAVKPGNWEGFKEEFRKKSKFGEWAYAGLKGDHDKVASEDVGRLSIAQDILRNTDFLRRIIAPVDGMTGVTLSYVCPHCKCFPLEDYIWWVSPGHDDANNRNKRQCSWWCAACGGKYDWRAPNRILVIQLSATERKFFSTRGTAGAVITLSMRQMFWRTSRYMVTVQLTSTVTGLHQISRIGIMDGLRNFIEVDNHDAVHVGGLRRSAKSIQVKKPQFSEAFPQAVIRESADEYILRAEEVGSLPTFSDTAHIEAERWSRRQWMRTGAPFVMLYTQDLKENNGRRCTITTVATSARDKKPGDSQKAKVLWTMKAARDREDEF